MPQPRKPLPVCAVVVATLAAVGLGASGCKNKSEASQAEALEAGTPGMSILDESLPNDSALRVESGVMPHDLDPYAGEMDVKNRYAATVMITTGDPMESVECSGVLVSPRLVLTAGSCMCAPRPVATPQSEEKTLVDGSSCAKRAAVTATVYGEVLDRKFKEVATQVEFWTYEGEVRPHPELELRLDERGAVVSSRADLAAIVLDKPVEHGLAGIPLADAEVQGNEMLVMAGYARDNQQRFGGFMRVRYFRRNKVQRLSPGGRALYEQQGAFLYNGYMGGPCLREKEGAEPALVGIASVDSDERLSFTSTYVFRDWLATEMRRAAGRGASGTGNSHQE
jgi:hypothetical protein